MMLARLRALTHFDFENTTNMLLCRNDVSPFKGIDTYRYEYWKPSICICRNDVSPFKGTDTQVVMLPLRLVFVKMPPV